MTQLNEMIGPQQQCKLVEWVEDYNTNDKIIAVLWGFKHFWMSKANAKRLIYDLKHNTHTTREYLAKNHVRAHSLDSFINYNRYWLNKLINKLHKDMNTKEVKIEIPDGYEIDKEKSTFEKIVFKPVVKRWRDNLEAVIQGYRLDANNVIRITTPRNVGSRGVFATSKQAKSALAMAQISQIMANDERFGGVVTDEEFKNKNTWIYAINRDQNTIRTYEGTYGIDHFLSFHTSKQRALFLKENEDLVKDYLMID